MNTVITFNKTYNERLQEYIDVLRTTDSSDVCAADVQKKWSSYLEVNIICWDWLAIWKIPRSTCELLKVEFPIVVIVVVEHIDFQKLTAVVKSLVVYEDILLSNRHFVVSLIELWPTTQQDRVVEFNLNATANAMDMLRIFYIYLFMPWDLEEDTSIDWLSEHLETRLTLFYDMRSDNFPKHKAVYIRELLTEARHLHTRQKQLIGDTSDTTLLNIKVRMAHIKNEIEILEDPLLRSAVLRKEQQLIMPKKQSSQFISLVLPVENNISDYILFLSEVQTQVGTENVQYKSSFSSALIDAGRNEMILLSKSKHVFESLCCLQVGGSIKGLYGKEDTVITSTKEDMLDVWGNLTFENLTIDISTPRFGILVRQGIVTLKDCKLTSSFESESQSGVSVSYGGTLNVINCDITGFDKAITVNSGGTLLLKDSIIYNVNVGLQIHDGSFITVQSTKFQNCEDYGIDLVTNLTSNEDQNGDFDILKMSSVQLENVTGEENGINCNITQVTKIDLVQELLDAQSDSSTDDEMDTTILCNEYY